MILPLGVNRIFKREPVGSVTRQVSPVWARAGEELLQIAIDPQAIAVMIDLEIFIPKLENISASLTILDRPL